MNTRNSDFPVWENDLLTDNGVIEAYIESCLARGLLPKTIRCYRQCLTYLHRWSSTRGKMLLELSKYDLRDYFLSLAGQVSPATINGRVRVLGAFYKFYKAEGLIELNPMASISYVRDPKKVKPIITADQLALALQQYDTKTFEGYRDMLIALLMFDSCLRLDEVLSLRRENLLFRPQRSITVLGKGMKERRVSFSPKTSIKLAVYLKLHRPDIPGDLLFPTKNGTKVNERNAYRSVARAASRAGLKINPHLLRHSGATAWLKATGNLEFIKSLLGHEDIRTTMRYLHTNFNDIAAKYEQMTPIQAVNI